MFKKYNDTPAAIAMGIYLLGALLYGLQLVFTSDSWLAAHDIDIAAIPLARALGAAYLGFSLGVILTFLNGPDGQKTFFTALGVAQVILFVVLWHARTMGNFENVLFTRCYCRLCAYRPTVIRVFQTSISTLKGMRCRF